MLRGSSAHRTLTRDSPTFHAIRIASPHATPAPPQDPVPRQEPPIVPSRPPRRRARSNAASKRHPGYQLRHGGSCACRPRGRRGRGRHPDWTKCAALARDRACHTAGCAARLPSAPVQPLDGCDPAPDRPCDAMLPNIARGRDGMLGLGPLHLLMAQRTMPGDQTRLAVLAADGPLRPGRVRHHGVLLHGSRLAIWRRSPCP